jgi:hypothetical protein
MAAMAFVEMVPGGMSANALLKAQCHLLSDVI